jgi:hypothetical protein
MTDSIILLEHVYSDGIRDIQEKFIGLFSSYKDAEDAVDRLKKVDGFKDWPDNFIVTSKKKNEINWNLL